MDMNIEIKDNVWAFIHKSAKLYGQMQEEQFAHEMQNNCLEIGMESPIEHLFWIAAKLLCEAAHTEFNGEAWLDRNGKEQLPIGIFIQPQIKIDKYRVDFLVSQHRMGPDAILTPVIVELDGHDFHDKDKRQRSYEKARDRHFLKAGYRVVHFTGSDVVSDPFGVAFEVLDLVGLSAASGITKYNPEDPLGLGG